MFPPIIDYYMFCTEQCTVPVLCSAILCQTVSKLTYSYRLMSLDIYGRVLIYIVHLLVVFVYVCNVNNLSCADATCYIIMWFP